ncbi:TonB-dependent receptor [Novosphingobium sp. Rr 2-17]|uniref:TonB-dependent receptor n=1 Tax=Novosphingobium sp. Rr 2-17 TaxID=555793 RepID=UPI00063EEE93|nr:TonB-dependent receptor [Novosphingobium sp. Rr 2-17]
MLAVAASGSAHAQESAAPAQPVAGVQDIIVTAERRTSNVQRTAASVTVKTGDELRQQGKFLLRDILENAPGINGGGAEAAPTTAGGGTDTVGAGIVIRGIRSNVGSGGSITSNASSVAVYTDDIYEGIGGNYDLDRVEILRGPQGTLYGRSATGGVVAAHTRDPNLDTFQVFGLAEAGNYDLQHFSGAVNVPIATDQVGLRVAGDYYHRDGFDQDNGLGQRTSKNLRVKLLLKPSDNFKVLLGAAIQYNEDATGGSAGAYDQNGKLYFTSTDPNINPVGAGKNHFHQFWANVQWDMGFATLTYIPAVRTWQQNALNVGIGPGFTILQTLKTPKDEFWTNEARLTSNGSGPLKWQVGALNYYNDLSNSNTVRFNLPGEPLAFASDTTKETKAFGVFGEATYSLTDAWRVTGGLRYDTTRINVGLNYTDGGTGQTLSLPYSLDNGRRKYKNWTYKARTEYDLSPQNLLYASFSTGFTPGDVAATSDVQGQPYILDLKDQTLKAYEIGSKNRFLGNKVQVNASAFYYDYSGYQNAGVDVDERVGIFTAFATLVSPVRIYGGELETVFQATSNDRIALNLAYTHARYVDSSAEFKTFISRSEVADVPPFTANLIYSHRVDFSGGSNLNLSADGRYLSAHDAGTITALAASYGGTSFIREKGLVIANLNATWTSSDGKFSIGGYVRNVTDKRYSTMTEVSLAGDPVTSVPTGISGATTKLTAPRTFGAIASVNF